MSATLRYEPRNVPGHLFVCRLFQPNRLLFWIAIGASSEVSVA
jgi:hypothetical protein